MSLVDRVATIADVYGAVCQLYVRFWNTTLVTIALWSQIMYIYVILYIVDNAGRYDRDFGREGLTKH